MLTIIDFTSKIEGTLYFFNGGRFDAYVVIKGMVECGIPIQGSSLIKNGGCIMNFNINPKCKVHDLYLFVDCSLATACKAWGVPDDSTKGEFDHSKIYSFESAELHKVEVLNYLKLDVAALRELYHIYSKVS